MVDFAENTETKQRIVKDVVCPKCYKNIVCPAVQPAQSDRCERITRAYYGWCFNCQCGFEVVQFKKDDKWHIHKFQRYEVLRQRIHCQPVNTWQIVKELPEPAPVVTGQGGDCDKHIDIDYFQLLKSVQEVLHGTSETLKNLISQRETEKNDQLPGL